jgi:hypothetical protein
MQTQDIKSEPVEFTGKDRAMPTAKSKKSSRPTPVHLHVTFDPMIVHIHTAKEIQTKPRSNAMRRNEASPAEPRDLAHPDIAADADQLLTELERSEVGQQQMTNDQ